MYTIFQDEKEEDALWNNLSKLSDSKMQLTKYNKEQIESIERKTSFGKKWLKMKYNEAERNKSNLGYNKD